MKNILAQYTLNSATKVLSLLDKGEFSPTYGCFDRNFWHYKTVTDYPSSTYQQLSLFLALLYTSNIEGNIYYQEGEILNFCLASIDYWKSIQNNDGSFNEWYPNEHSHVATAFTLYAITESLLLIKNNLSKEKLKKYFNCITKAANWLTENPDTVVINHTAGALTAIYNCYLLTGKKDLLDFTEKNLLVLQEYQSPEGWFNEYYGADIGYTSVTIDYLAKYYEKSGDERAYNMLEKAVTFISYFIHPDGSSGGEYGNRNTKYLMPAGIHILAKYFDNARYILTQYYKGLEQGTQLNLDTYDDRYFSFFFAPNYFEAAILFESINESNFQYNERAYEKYSHIFSQAGIVVKKTDKYYLVCNFKKGGVIKLYNVQGDLLYADSSYFIKFKNNKVASSQRLTTYLEYYIDNSNDDEIEIKFESCFIWVNTSLPLTKVLIPFRIFNYTLGRFNLVMDYFNKYIKRFFISRPKDAPLKLKRTISIKNNTLIIEDAISKATDEPVILMELPAAKTNLHVPSSRYSISYDIKEFQGVKPECIEEINKLKVAYMKTQVPILNKEDQNEISSANSTEQTHEECCP